MLSKVIPRCRVRAEPSHSQATNSRPSNGSLSYMVRTDRFLPKTGRNIFTPGKRCQSATRYMNARDHVGTVVWSVRVIHKTTVPYLLPRGGCRYAGGSLQEEFPAESTGDFSESPCPTTVHLPPARGSEACCRPTSPTPTCVLSRCSTGVSGTPSDWGR